MGTRPRPSWCPAAIDSQLLAEENGRGEAGLLQWPFIGQDELGFLYKRVEAAASSEQENKELFM